MYTVHCCNSMVTGSQPTLYQQEVWGLESTASPPPSPLAIHAFPCYRICHFIMYHALHYVNVGCWTSQANTNIENGRPDPASSISTCQAACLANTQCTGFDYVRANAAPQRCWLSGPWSGTRNNGTATGITHYDINRHHCSG